MLTSLGQMYETWCENPNVIFNTLPCNCALYPTPTNRISLTNPSHTPFIIFATSDLAVPACDHPFELRSLGRHVTLSPSIFTSTVLCIIVSRRPFGPTTLTKLPVFTTTTPVGTPIGIFAIRDISSYQSLCHYTNYFTAMPRRTSFPICHQTFRSRYNRYSQTVHYLGQLILPSVDSQTGFAYPNQFFNYRSSFKIFKNYCQLRLTIHFFHCIISYVSLVLQYSRDFKLMPRHRNHRSNLPSRLPIPNARYHV